MSNCLNISHTCLDNIPNGRTLLFWSDLFVVGRVVGWEWWESSGKVGKGGEGESSELGRWERCVRVVRCQFRKGEKVVR